jgi:hypothetical protein
VAAGLLELLGRVGEVEGELEYRICLSDTPDAHVSHACRISLGMLTI